MQVALPAPEKGEEPQDAPTLPFPVTVLFKGWQRLLTPPLYEEHWQLSKYISYSPEHEGGRQERSSALVKMVGT